MTPWQTAFDAVVLQRLRADPTSTDAWRRYRETRDLDVVNALANRGQLDRTADWRSAWWGAFRYQRYHADALVSAFAGSYRPKIDRVFFDVGCGGGTGAIAIHEHIRNVPSSVRIAYIGSDHNPHAVDLAERLLTTGPYDDIDPLVLTTDPAEALRGCLTLIGDGWSPFVVMSYLLRQHAVTAPVVDTIADSIVQIVLAAAPRVVPLFVTDPAWDTPRNFDRLCARLASSVEVTGRRVPRTLEVPIRFPNLYPDDEGWLETRGSRPNIHCWTLRLKAT